MVKRGASRMGTRFWNLAIMLVGLVPLGGYVAAQATVACTPIGGVIVENFNEEFLLGEDTIVLGAISGDLSGGTFSVWPSAGKGTPAEGVITLESGDTLRVQSQRTVSDVEGGFRHVVYQVAILSGTGAYRRAVGSFEAHGSMKGSAFDELVTRYRGEVCVPAR
jgi:hypothetical protein